MPPERESPYTFIVRLWREKSDGESIWRGSVNHVQSGERAYFQDVTHLVGIISRAMKGVSMQERPRDSSHTDNDMDQK